jgi:hypothetical protein
MHTVMPWEEIPSPWDIDVAALNIDTSYQATMPRNPRLIKDIAERFDIALFGRLRVSRRLWLPNYPLYVFDGRHRLQAAKLAVRGTVPCDVYNLTTLDREIALFVDSNTRLRKVPQGMLFMAELAAKQEDAVKLSQLVSEAGLTIVDSNTAKDEFPTPKLTCIAALKSLYGHGSKSYARRAAPVDHEKLSKALAMIATIAPPNALVTEHMVLGMVWLIQNYPIVRLHTDRLADVGWERLDLAARAVGPRPVSREAGEALLAVIDYKRPRDARLAPNTKLPAPPSWLPPAAV